VETVTTRLPHILPALNDVLQERHLTPKLLAYYRDALREACVLRPDLFATDVNFQANAGVDQEVPLELSVGPGPGYATGVHLLDVYRVANSREITKGDYNTFRAFNSGWRDATPAPAVMWMRKPGSEKTGFHDRHFFLFPPQVGNEQIVACVATLREITDENTPIFIDDQYLPALDAYVVHRCEAEDDEHAVAGRSAASYQKFTGLLTGGRAVKEAKVLA
jgi:hypothetical protein